MFDARCSKLHFLTLDTQIVHIIKPGSQSSTIMKLGTQVLQFFKLGKHIRDNFWKQMPKLLQFVKVGAYTVAICESMYPNSFNL
jgi:hypothetical protein